MKEIRQDTRDVDACDNFHLSNELKRLARDGWKIEFVSALHLG